MDPTAHWPAIDTAVATGHLSSAAADRIKTWLERPAFAETREALDRLIQSADWPELERLFWERLPFGTGGRRGVMADLGTATINRRTIAESADGLARYVARQFPGQLLRAAISFDTRHRSEEFARLSARVLAARGFHVWISPAPRATPELSFAVRQLECQAGVMISASHNPPSDNGFKAYWCDGGQILPPHDAGIIAEVDAADEIPLADWDQATASGQIQFWSASLDEAYIAAVSQLSVSSRRDMPALFTPLHGVGASSALAVLRAAGFQQIELFEPQSTPDGDFPGVPDHLPNPERPAALTPAITAARAQGLPLVLATDPDADRIAVAVQRSGQEFVCLTGNQAGALLADFRLRHLSASGQLTPQHYIVQTLVTTPLIGRIARGFGIQWDNQSLVGCKYLARKIEDWGADRLVLGAEESLGYLGGNHCRDKDASVGALWLMELAAELHARQRTLWDQLLVLFETYGAQAERQLTHTCPGAAGLQLRQRIMDELRQSPPAQLGRTRFSQLRDYQAQEQRSLPRRLASPLSGPIGDLLIFEGQQDDLEIQFAARPSGTEPKIKFYLFASARPGMPAETGLALVEGALVELEQSLQIWLQELLKRG